jgi:hypothetical protein
MIDTCPFCQSPLQIIATNPHYYDCPHKITDVGGNYRSHFIVFCSLSHDDKQTFQARGPGFLINWYEEGQSLIVYAPKHPNYTYHQISRKDQTTYQDFLNMYLRLKNLKAFL